MIYSNNYPLSDDAMFYDSENKCYVLKYDYIKAKTGVDLLPMINSPYITDKTVAVNNMLTDMAQQIYNYVYSFNPKFNYWQEYLMAKSPLARENILKAQLKQLSYMLRNGKLNEFAGVNISVNDEHSATPLYNLRGDRAIHPEAIIELKKPLEDGERLLFNGHYDVPYEFGSVFRVGY